MNITQNGVDFVITAHNADEWRLIRAHLNELQAKPPALQPHLREVLDVVRALGSCESRHVSSALGGSRTAHLNRLNDLCRLGFIERKADTHPIIWTTK